jgi:CubicO group peptidase (beta-lactamase class C family)
MKLWFFLLLLLLAQPGQSDALATPEPMAAADIAQFSQQLDKLRRAASIPGLSVVVLKENRIVLATGMGYANVEQKIAATADTAYDLASVTKPLSAVVALRLAEEGLLQLDRPMHEYSDWADFCTAFSQQPSIFARDLHCQPAVHTLRQLLSHTAAGVPGSYFSYNPVLYSWASRPMMAVTGKAFSALTEHYVFSAAGMLSSARKHRNLALLRSVANHLAPPYRLNTMQSIERAPAMQPQGDGAAGGIVSTVLDLARFDIALEQGRLLSAASYAAMLQPVTTTNGNVAAYSLGWFTQQYHGHKLLWHSGWWPEAYSALYLKVPAQQLTFIILANSEGIWWDNPLDSAQVQNSEFAQAFLQAFLPD